MSKSRNVGSDNGRAKLNDEYVRDIRFMWRGETSASVLADMYGVTVRCIYYVVRNKTWKHVKS